MYNERRHAAWAGQLKSRWNLSKTAQTQSVYLHDMTKKLIRYKRSKYSCTVPEHLKYFMLA